MLYKKMSPVGCHPGILYGRLHKPLIYSFPFFRPIPDVINTSSYKLAAFLVSMLSPLTINEYTVKDSLAFAKKITKTDCEYGFFRSLITNISLEEDTENCVNDLFFDKSKIDNLT